MKLRLRRNIQGVTFGIEGAGKGAQLFQPGGRFSSLAFQRLIIRGVALGALKR